LPFTSWATSNTETIKFSIGSHGEAAGFYRYALFATCDVYVAVVHNLTDNEWAYEYSVFSKPNSLFEGINYSTTNEFGSSANAAMSLKFDTVIIDYLTTPEQQRFIVTFSNGSTVLKTQTVEYNGNATPPANPTKSGYDFLAWYIGDEPLVVDDPLVLEKLSGIGIYVINYPIIKNINFQPIFLKA